MKDYKNTKSVIDPLTFWDYAAAAAFALILLTLIFIATI
jgi:hypothetical protein